MSKWDRAIELISEGVKPTMRSKSMSDYIDRKEFLAMLKRECGECMFDNTETCSMCKRWQDIVLLSFTPSVDVVEVRHGRWIGKIYKCSLCGKWVDPLQGDADMNYCPNCGARMDRKE